MKGPVNSLKQLAQSRGHMNYKKKNKGPIKDNKNDFHKVLTSRYSVSNFESSTLFVSIWASTALRFSFSSAKGSAQSASIV